jgi:hypothetical protein
VGPQGTGIVALTAVLVAAGAPSAHAGAFGGATLDRASIGVTFQGMAYPRVRCALRTVGLCQGTITIRRNGQVLGFAPLAMRSGDGPAVEVQLRGGRRDRIFAGGTAVTVTVRVHDFSIPPRFRTTTSRGTLVRG